MSYFLDSACVLILIPDELLLERKNVRYICDLGIFVAKLHTKHFQTDAV